MRWPTATLGSIGQVITGSTPRSSEIGAFGSDVPFVTPGDLDGTNPLTQSERYLSRTAAMKARLLPPDSVLVSCIGNLGKSAIAGTEVVTNQQINAVIFDHTKVFPKFGYYACRLLKRRMEAMAPATTLPIISKSKFEALEIPVPPLDEQRRIAAILDKAEELRSKRRAAIALLDQLPQAIFIEMFGDPATNPKGWPLKRFGDLAAKFSDGPFGSNLKSSHYTDKGIRVWRLQNVGVGELVDDDKAFISEGHFNKLRRHQCDPGDVIVGTLGDPNLRAFIQPASVPIALNKADCVQVRPLPSVSDAAYICWLCNSRGMEVLANSGIQGQTRLRISMGRLREISVPLPALDLQHQFAVRVEAIQRAKSTRRAALAELDALFASLQSSFFGAKV